MTVPLSVESGFLARSSPFMEEEILMLCFRWHHRYNYPQIIVQSQSRLHSLLSTTTRWLLNL